jgi:hypothetical protein
MVAAPVHVPFVVVTVEPTVGLLLTGVEPEFTIVTVGATVFVGAAGRYWLIHDL